MTQPSNTNSGETQLATRPAKAPVVANKHGLVFNSLDDMWRFAVACVNSGDFRDIKTPEQALIRLQAGMELGLTPLWSLVNIMVVQGRPVLWGDALLGLVRSKPDFRDIEETITGEGDKMIATCKVVRGEQTPVVRSFSAADAKRAGLWGKAGTWTQYPDRMLRMRARSYACRDAYADALRGLGVREELQDVPEKQANAREVTGLVLPDEVPAVESAREEAQEATLL